MTYASSGKDSSLTSWSNRTFPEDLSVSFCTEHSRWLGRLCNFCYTEEHQDVTGRNGFYRGRTLSAEKRSEQDARSQLEQIRAHVPTAPKLEIDGAPDWLYTVEEMREFFSNAASVWDQVFGGEQEDALYQAVAGQIAPTAAPIEILVLGCGTGLELPAIFAKAPNTQITGIDIAPGMLAELRKKFVDRSAQIELREQSYVGISLDSEQFDYVIATLTTHHLAPESKLDLYREIRTALKPNGRYIEGDQSTSQAGEAEALRWYHAYIAKLPGGERAEWNYDITLSPETQEQLLLEAGFTQVRLTWEERDEVGHGLAVFVASDEARMLKQDH